MVCKRSQHVGPNNVASCWQTMLRAFARALKVPNQLAPHLEIMAPLQAKISHMILGGIHPL